VRIDNVKSLDRFRDLALAAIFCALISLARAQPASDLAGISLPPGFSVNVWVDGVTNARSLALGDEGTVFVSTRRDGRVYAVISQPNGTRKVITIADGLRMPNGIAFKDDALYVAENHRIIRFDSIEQSLGNLGAPIVITDSLPTERHHGWRYIKFGPDNKLYVALGAPCNVCEQQGLANIIRMNADGSGQEIYAEGIRNSVGFAWHPDTSELWFTDNGRDLMGDDIPPGELNKVSAPFMHFGFPYCHGGDIPDPEFGEKRLCSEFEPPVQKLGPHVAPLGMIFYTGSMFPVEYKNQVLIAEHGSWNRSRKIGYRISLVRIKERNPVGYETFVDGWLQGEDVLGRPVDLLQLPDGSLLLSDDQNGLIYRITYKRPIDEGVST
tara:strand:- start:251 stop:1396 length:1146 start_codon:yes stop_codon:yes gene_type:complete